MSQKINPLRAVLSGIVFLIFFALSSGGLYLYLQNRDILLPITESDSDITPLKLYNTGVLKYHSKDIKGATESWFKGITHSGASDTELFYLSANLGIAYLHLAQDKNSDIKNRIRYATDAVNSLRDAWSYLQIIPEKKEYETMVRVAAEQAKRFYADIMEKHISDKPPLEIIQELLTREENIQKQLNTLKNISPGDPKVKQLIKEQQKIISLMNTLP